MSARLIKIGQGIGTLPFAAFSIPTHDEQEEPVSSFYMPPAPATIYAEEPESEALKIIAEAKDRAVDIERQAREAGHASMQEEITAAVAQTVEPWRAQIAETLQELAGLREVINEQAERDLVRLALEIARKVVHREVTIDKEIVMTLARIGLSRVHNRTSAAIHLHPEDFAYLNNQRERIESSHVLELIEDRSISRGGCLIHTEMGDVDARIEQQFAEIERAFLET